MLNALLTLEGFDFRNQKSPHYCQPPELDHATLDGVNITSRIKEIYGKDKGWSSKFWKGYELMGHFDGEKNLEICWIYSNGQVMHKLSGRIGNDDVINLPTEMPDGSYWISPSGKYNP